MIYEYLLSMINKATGGTTKQLGGTLLIEEKTMGGLYLGTRFCLALTDNLVMPYIILTFCQPLQLGYAHRQASFCVQVSVQMLRNMTHS